MGLQKCDRPEFSGEKARREPISFTAPTVVGKAPQIRSSAGI
jgi:hypothetical protein